MKKRKALTWYVTAVMCYCSLAHAAYQDDIGYTQLTTELGAATPDGSGVAVTQVEAETADGEFSPNKPGATTLSGKVFVAGSAGSTDYSPHAFGVASLFYGNSNSIAPGITNIKYFSAEGWAQGDFLRAGEVVVPDYTTHDSRVANHSWIGFLEDPDTEVYDRPLTLEAVQRLDWVISTDDYIHVAGVNNGSSSYPLNMEAFNTITVGNLSGTTSTVTSTLLEGGGNPYVEGRIIPLLVATNSATSNATPVISAAAALLVETADANPAFSLNRSHANASRANQTIYDGATSEAIKAILMAGASRIAINQQTDDTYTLATVSATTPDPNGLDYRFGAGVLNIYNSYHILASGEVDSDEDDGGGSGSIDATYGWDYDESFGDLGDNSTGTYRFSLAETLMFMSTLTWNADIDIDQLAAVSPTPDSAATLYDLDLALYDVTGGGNTLVSESASSTQNTETTWTTLLGGRDYELRVTTTSSNFEWDYAVAWRTEALVVPEPGSLAMLILAGIGGTMRRSNDRRY